MEARERQPADWDMTPYFSAHGGDDYQHFVEALAADRSALTADLLAAPALKADTVPLWGELLTRLEDLATRSSHLSSYLGCLGAADARDEKVKRDAARLAAARAELDTLYVKVRSALAAADDAIFAELLASERLAKAGYFLTRLRRAPSAAWRPSSSLWPPSSRSTGSAPGGASTIRSRAP